MKKYILLAVLIGLGTFTFLFSTEEKVLLNDLVKANIEALSKDEFDAEGRCGGTGSLDCPYSDDKVDYVVSGYSLRYTK